MAPLLGFVNINFDGSVKDSWHGASYVIRDLDARLLVARVSCFI